jgi:hypothetical protein
LRTQPLLDALRKADKAREELRKSEISIRL